MPGRREGRFVIRCLSKRVVKWRAVRAFKGQGEGKRHIIVVYTQVQVQLLILYYSPYRKQFIHAESNRNDKLNRASKYSIHTNTVD